MPKLLLVIISVGLVAAQTQINGSRTIRGNWDASQALSVKPFKQGTSLPGSCETGESYMKTDEVAGLNLYHCTSTNTWTRTPYAQGTSAPGACSVGQIFFDTDATAGQNLYFCTNPDTWTQMTGGGSGNAGAVLLAFQSAAPAIALTGAGNDIDMYRYTVPGGALGPGKCLRTEWATQHSAGSATVVQELHFGLSAFVVTSSSMNASTTVFHGLVCNNPGVTNAQQLIYRFGNGGAASAAPAFGTGTADTTSDQDIFVTASGANTEQVTLKYFILELLK